MKVFLSWSGEKSHKVAKVFRDWLPSVIQSLYPYVSSEDIDKGARWSTDIAKELEDATFGILCVTKENMSAPWLNFEAGALSKTMDNSFVSPFLFDVKRSEVKGPILQFQSTIFENGDILKLIKTINRACGEEALSDDRLLNAFEVWYPPLEKQLNDLKTVPDEKDNITEVVTDKSILEEILELTRINQKLLRNPSEVNKELSEIKDAVSSVIDKYNELIRRSRARTIPPRILEEMLHAFPHKDKYIAIQIILGLIKEEFPWLYVAGMEASQVIKSSKNPSVKKDALKSFMHIVEISLGHLSLNDFTREDKQQYILLKNLGFVFQNLIEDE